MACKFALLDWDELFASLFLEAASADKAVVYASDGGFAVPPETSPPWSGLIVDSALRQKMGTVKLLLESSLRWAHNIR